VAIATVTDVMPLTGENRVLEKYGLIVLNKTRRPGLRSIIESAGLTWGKLDTVSVGFAIGPRLNAASRMDHASAAFVALMAADAAEAAVAAERLNQLNKDRQKYTEEIYRAAKAMAEAESDAQVLVMKGEGWSAGIVGLVAGKLVTEFGKPAFVFGQEGDKMVGSGRTVPGYNVVTAMERAKEKLFRYGGHPQACGLTIMGEENYDAFKEAALAYAAEAFGERVPEPELAVDGELKASEVTPEFVDAVLSLEPYGEGNRCPKFALRDLVVTGINYVGKTKAHVQLTVKGDTPAELKLIGFNFADRVENLGIRSRVDVVVEVGINEWNGMRRPEFRIVDLQPAGGAARVVDGQVAVVEEPAYAAPMYVI
jgi:single-stranded-DNA-specific exonuclease